jgi:hypothetical protein
MLPLGASHAFLSNMLIDGRPDLAKDLNRGFELASAGAAIWKASKARMVTAVFFNLLVVPE